MREVIRPLLPPVTGTEEELRIHLAGVDDIKMVSPLSNDQISEVFSHVSTYCSSLPTNKEFKENGGRFYFDKGIEVATPECSDPEMQKAYIDANASLINNGVADWLHGVSKRTGRAMTVVQQRRVI